MSFRCGIVGMPNVGKSTLFNALNAHHQAVAENYPFCTIEPNIGQVEVPDERLEAIARIVSSKKKLPTTLQFVDIAGLVKGASQGEGLGNQFLSHIRQVDAILHVLRCFHDPQITHVNGQVNPLDDKEIIETELMLADLQSLQTRLSHLQKKVRGSDKEAKELKALCEKAGAWLSEGLPVRDLKVTSQERPLLQQLHLLTHKPIFYVCNVQEKDIASPAQSIKELQTTAPVLVIAAQTEAEIAALPSQEQKEFLQTMGLKELGLHAIIRAGYKILGLKTFFTAGPKEARAWTVPVAATAHDAARVIHSDFQRGFICAEVIAFKDFERYNGEQGAKNKGVWRQEGQNYVVCDGDVIVFRFAV